MLSSGSGTATDFNGDGVVDFEDFFLLATAFGSKQGMPAFNDRFDLDSSGEVDFNDFFIFAGSFGQKASKGIIVTRGKTTLRW